MEQVKDDFDESESLRLKMKALRIPGLDPQYINDFYNKWGNKFDEQVCESYTGPHHCVKAAVERLEGNPDPLILDIGCGTGLVAEKLAEHGFRNIEGLEPSEGMVQKAREKNLYKKIYECFLTDKVDCLDTDRYDAVVGCGVLAVNHVPPAALSEVVRCLKPGGHAVFMTYCEYLSEGPMREAMTRLEEESRWKLLHQTTAPYFLGKQGLVLVFLKTSKHE